jgi:hypothetical protein
MKRLFIILLFISSKCFAFGPVTIWLDFKGGVVSGTLWNSIHTAGAPIIYSAASFAGNADSVAFIRNSVAEAYAAFNITVTTDSTVYYATPIGSRIKMIFTRTYSWYGSSQNGTSFQGSLYYNDENPCWGFQIRNSSGDPLYDQKNIADVCIHEPGHALGLTHQSTYNGSCVLTAVYNTGSGTGQTACGPIMGNPYIKNMSIWWYGKPQTGCDQVQDDVSQIANGDGNVAAPGLVLNDVGTKWETAKILQKGVSAYQLLGHLDNDFYKIVIPATTTVTITAVPLSQGANNLYAKVDLAIDVLNENREPVATSNNTTTLDASVVTILRTGVYYVKIRPDTSNSNNPTGYGFIGHYTINMNY